MWCKFMMFAVVCTAPSTEQQKLALTRIKREEQDPGAQVGISTKTSESLVWGTFTGPHFTKSNHYNPGW